MEEIRENEVFETEETGTTDLVATDYDSGSEDYSETKSRGSGVLGYVGGVALIGAVGYGAYRLGKKLIGKVKDAKAERKEFKEWKAAKNQKPAGNVIETDFVEQDEDDESDDE